MLKEHALYDRPGGLMLCTISLLKEKNLFEVYAETRIPYHWLKKFTKGAYQNPSVNRVQFLYEHLSGHKLVT